MRQGTYDKLNERGYAPEETVLENGDILLGKVSPIQAIGNSNKIFKDSSVYYKSHISGVVDRVYTDLYNNDGYEMRKVRVRSERIPMIGDKICLLDIADVLTDKGWVNITKITKDHNIATLVDGKYLKYVKPIDTYSWGYKGQMYKLRSQLVDIDCTIDHELYVKKRDHSEFELVKASDIYGKRFKLKKWAENNNPDIENIQIGNKTIKMDDFLDFLGIFIADGWVENNNTRIAISGEKERKIKPLYDVCKKLNIEVYSDKVESSDLNDLGVGPRHLIHDRDFINYLEKYSVGALNKYLPEFIWNVSQRQSVILLESLISCDGSRRTSGSVCYYTSSDKLANDVMRLAIHAGWSGTKGIVREKGSPYEIYDKRSGKTSKGVTNADALAVRIVKTKNEPTINHGHCKTQNGQSEELYDYEGNVYCLEVPSHVFMMRQNGKNVFVGNCSRHRYFFNCVEKYSSTYI